MKQLNIKELIAVFIVVDLFIFLFSPYHLVSMSHADSAASGFDKKAAIETSRRMGEIASIKNELPNWPPKLNQKFPDVALVDHQGRTFSFETLKGKPVLIEFIAMTCAACQAWSGAHKYGVFENLAAQQDLSSIEEYYKQYTPGLDLFDGKISFVQLIVYDTALEAPAVTKLAEWRKHFKFDQHKNTFIVTGGKALRNQESFRRVPGFMLLDKNGVVRFDALGHTPKHNPYTELLPGVKSLL